MARLVSWHLWYVSFKFKVKNKNLTKITILFLGCGKSVIARCIANAFETFAPNNHPGYPKCAISAPTGKAADNVGGMTLHGTYTLPLTQESTAADQANERKTEETDVIPRLEDQRLARLQNNFCDMYGHLIDEV